LEAARLPLLRTRRPKRRANIAIFRPEGRLSAEVFAQSLTIYVVLLFSLSFHESAHAWTALKMGDTTADEQGRISMNPLVHIDPIGTVLLPLLMLFGGGGMLFGWAKPTPVNPRAFTDVRKGQILVSGAGPASNLVLAVAATLILFLLLRLAPDLRTSSPAVQLLAMGVQLNVLLALFNLVPLPPLDGWHVASWSLPRQLAESYQRLVGPWGSWILLLLVVTGALGSLLGPLTGGLSRMLFSIAAR
jgi:Zn-dependent protease